MQREGWRAAPGRCLGRFCYTGPDNRNMQICHDFHLCIATFSFGNRFALLKIPFS